MGAAIFLFVKDVWTWWWPLGFAAYIFFSIKLGRDRERRYCDVEMDDDSIYFSRPDVPETRVPISAISSVYHHGRWSRMNFRSAISIEFTMAGVPQVLYFRAPGELMEIGVVSPLKELERKVQACQKQK